MRKAGFEAFCQEVREAGYKDGIWFWTDYWYGMTANQRRKMAEILETHPAVMKLERNGVKVYQLPNGREFEV